MSKQLKVGDKIRVGTGPNYNGYRAEVVAVIQREWPRPHEQYEVKWTDQGGTGHVDQIFHTDWRAE